MNEKMRKELDTALDSYNTLLDEVRRKKAAEDAHSTSAKEQFLAAFADLRKEVVRPVMEEVGQILKQKGHDFKIIEHNEYYVERGNGHDPDIIFSIHTTGPVKGLLLTGEQPRAGYFANTYGKKVIFAKNENGPSFGYNDPQFDIAHVTKESVEKDLTEFIKETFALDSVKK